MKPYSVVEAQRRRIAYLEDYTREMLGQCCKLIDRCAELERKLEGEDDTTD